MRIQYKGGVWKNSEDEILKAAVMKYGKNQWARIASLLVRKSAKQCKARWYEWLDPSIKKTQWTREEEEKLLHLVKIMPTSWKTIAPMIGRTAAQCIEHYEKLLDRSQRGASESADGAGPSTAISAANKPRPGDIDAVPESRPARPDPVDMDEDELEMLSEARARLANTKGKKAKRKAREKQLEVAKRLAQLQKRRELKAAGVDLKPKRRNRKVTDYATEIPFQRAPVPGFYDTREENERIANENPAKKQLGKILRHEKEKQEKEREEEERRREAEKKLEREKDKPPAILDLNKDNIPRSPPLKRSRISLPEPQVSDLELEKVAKVGAATPMGNIGAFEGQRERSHPASVANSMRSMIRTPSGNPELWSSVRQRHLETIVNLKNAQTPLRGGTDTPMSLGLESGVLPTPSQLRTPNPLATPLSVSNDSHPLGTVPDPALQRAEEERRLREKLRRGFSALPKPENEYQLDFEQSMFTQINAKDRENRVDIPEEDAEEEERRNKPRHEREIEIEKDSLLSSAAKRSLPLPGLKNSQLPKLGIIENLVRTDVATHQVLGRYELARRSASTVLQELRSLREHEAAVEDVNILKARKLIEEEMSSVRRGGFDLEKAIFEQLRSVG